MPGSRLPLDPRAVLRIVREVRAEADRARTLVLAGAPGPSFELAARLGEGGDGSALSEVTDRRLGEDDLAGAAALIYCVERAPGREDEPALRAAARAGVPVVCVLVGAATTVPRVPYVYTTDVVPTGGADVLPFERVAERIAVRLGERGPAVAARLPVLRGPICVEIVRRASRHSGLVGAAFFVPGADYPVLALNQARMILRLAAAHGLELDRERALELAAALGLGLGVRALAREATGLLPGPGWAYKGLLAYSGTRVIGEAAITRFSSLREENLTREPRAGREAGKGRAVRSGS